MYYSGEAEGKKVLLLKLLKDSFGEIKRGKFPIMKGPLFYSFMEALMLVFKMNILCSENYF
jgi:hypothetical protein